MKTKPFFETPEVLVVRFEAQDLITTSGTTPSGSTIEDLIDGGTL